MAFLNLDAQECTYVAMALFPGWLAVIRVLTPIQATSLVVIAYWMYRLNTWNKNKKAQLEEAKAEEAKKKAEEEALLAMNSKRRKNVLKALSKRQATEADGVAGDD
jgi:flagellar biosynthesis component FlhA